MIHLLAMALCVPGFAALALAMERHQEDCFGRVLPRRITLWLRVAGWSLLTLALWVLVIAEGWGMALVAYSGHTSLAAGLVYGALVIHQRRKAR